MTRPFVVLALLALANAKAGEATRVSFEGVDYLVHRCH
jgi:hypothetical protein